MVVEARENLLIRLEPVEIVEAEPFHREVCDKTGGPGIGKHSLDLDIQYSGLRQFLGSCQLEQFVIRAGIPDEKRQTRRQFEIRESGLRIGLRRLDATNRAIKELRTRQHCREKALDSRVELSAFLPSGFIERHQPGEIGIRNGPAESAPRQVLGDLLRTGRFSSSLRLAHIDQAVT